MSAGLAGALAVVLCPFAGRAADGTAESEVFYIDASLDLDGLLASWAFVDVDGDGALELVLAVCLADGERELRVHELSAHRLESVPKHTVRVLGDVIAWGCADVRSEPGRELLFLTRGGVWSYSLTRPGYRDNVSRLVVDDLLYDLPDPRALEHWEYIIPGSGSGADGRDLVLLPDRTGYAIWGATGEEDAPYGRRARFEDSEDDGDDRGSVGDRPRRAEMSFSSGGSSPFLREDPRGTAALLSDSRKVRAPALMDLDGDGFLDLLRVSDEALTIHMGGPDGPSADPTRVEPLPKELMAEDGESVELTLIDLDGDGDLDLLAHVEEDVDGFENALHRIFIYRGNAERLIGAKPDQVLRFEAAMLRVEVTDVDGDGRVDLAFRKLELPSVVAAVTGLEFTFTYLVYMGGRKGFDKRPTLDHEETYDEDTVVGLAANRELTLDCDGDGIADLVEVDLDGRIAIRRVIKTSSFLRGETWSLERAPWKRFAGEGSIESLVVRDLNGDGLGDVISAGERRFSLWLSSRGRQRR
ncbi:MAG: hypothetical protein E2O39_15120 [Planctomycetota bacterium]|nr:MAG: hypothetical protein E2O39_15120 [Planctomycetota bacterium]